MKNQVLIGLTMVMGITQYSGARDKTMSTRDTPLSVEEALKSFTLPEGFVIELVAAEKQGVINPIDLTFDNAGRLWTQTAVMYPADAREISLSQLFTKEEMAARGISEKGSVSGGQLIKEFYQLKRKGKDKIIVIEEPTAKQLKPVHVWADGLSLPQSVMPYKNGALVAHGSEFFYMEDTNGDGKQDKVTTVMTGFGIHTTR